VSGTRQQLVRLPQTKDEMGFAIGRTSLAIAAITDAGIGKSLVEALGQPEKYKTVLEELDALSRQAKLRQQEAKAHARNKRFGKTAKQN
jgi:hypothetical protein